MMTVMNMRSISLGAAGALMVAVLATSLPAHAMTETEGVDLARQAYRTLGKGQPEAAIAQYDEAINSRTLPPETLANALLNRALARQQLGQQEEAIADYAAALNLDAMSGPLRATALYNRGLSQHKLGHLPLAIEDYTGALLLNSELPQAFLSRGQALRESGQLLFALSDFERALLFGHPNVARVNYLTGLTYEQLNRKIEARRHYDAALAADPRNAQARARIEALGEIEVATADKSAPETLALASGTSEIMRPVAEPAVEPSAELLAEAQVKMPPVEEKIVDRMPAAVEVAVAAPVEASAPQEPAPVYTASELASADVTASITPAPAPTTLDAVPAIPDKAEPQSANIETVGPETPAVDTVVAATQSREPVPAPKPDVVATPTTGWTIQLVSATSEQGAWDSWAKMQKRNKTLSDLKPVVVRADLGTKGIVYRVRLAGYDAQEPAKTACKKLKAKGINCFVSKASG
jgi:tetratricopeptide (TPR) repeat protein